MRLSFAVEKKPDRALDLATLDRRLHGRPGDQGSRASSATTTPSARSSSRPSRPTGERAWRLPLDDDFKEQLKSQVADLKNVGGKWGGAITAAKFLEQFVGTTPWVHLDIAGPSWAESDSSSRDVGATGCFVRTLVRFIERMADPG